MTPSARSRATPCGTLLIVLTAAVGVAARAQQDPAALVERLASDDLALRREAVDDLTHYADGEAVAAATIALLHDVARFPPMGRHDVLGWNTAVGVAGRFRRDDPFALEEPDVLVRDAPATNIFAPAPVIEDDLDLHFAWPARALAAFVLGARGQAHATVVQALLVAVGDEDEIVAAQAAHALVRLGDACAPAVLEAFRAGPDWRLESVLRRWPAATAAALPRLLASDDDRVVRRACGLARQCGDDAPGVHAALVSGLTQAPRALRAHFVRALADLGAPTASALLPLLRAEGTPRRLAAGTLALMEPADGREQLDLPDAVLDALVDAAEGAPLTTAHWAARALAKAGLEGPRRERLRASLLQRTRAGNVPQRMVGCEHLGALGIGDDEARGALLRCLFDDAQPVSRAAGGAFAALGPPLPGEVMSWLLECAGDDTEARSDLVLLLQRDGETRAALCDPTTPGGAMRPRATSSGRCSCERPRARTTATRCAPSSTSRRRGSRHSGRCSPRARPAPGCRPNSHAAGATNPPNATGWQHGPGGCRSP